MFFTHQALRPLVLSLLLGLTLAAPTAFAQQNAPQAQSTTGYREPVADLKAIVDAPRPPRLSLSPRRDLVALQQQLDDARPDSDDERRAWYGGIIRLTDEADAVLDEQAERFDALRALERNAPTELKRVQAEAKPGNTDRVRITIRPRDTGAAP